MQRRLHPRVRLRLPARLRWSAPLGQRTDQCETINVSRGGLLLACTEAHRAGNPLWVTIPFDPDDSGAQPETLARVVRCAKSNGENLGGGPGRWIVAMHFEGTAHSQSRRDGNLEADKNHNGDGSKIALPIRVRPKNVPWYEEAMTIEVSREKLKFVTNREYAFGERLLLSFVSGSEAPWSGDGEWETQVTGIEMEAGSDSLCVTLRKKSQ
jgi:PilZ domain